MSLVALLWTLSNLSMSFLWYGLHAWMQYSKCGLTIALYNGMIKVLSIYVMFLLINPKIWFPFAAASPHCSETVMSALTVTPKSFSFTLVPNIVLPIKHSLLTLPCPMWMHLHLPKLNNICPFSELLTNLVRSSCKVSFSVSVFTVKWLFRVASIHIIGPGRSVMLPEVVLSAMRFCIFNLIEKHNKSALQYARWLTTLKQVDTNITHAYIPSPHWRQRHQCHSDALEIILKKLVSLASIRLCGRVMARNRKRHSHYDVRTLYGQRAIFVPGDVRFQDDDAVDIGGGGTANVYTVFDT